MTQKLLPVTAKSFIFACTNSSQNECFERLLFGSSKVYGATAMRVKKGDFLFLWNLDTDLLYGVFKASTDAKMNIVPEAWGGNYPYQVKVEPLGKIYPLKDAKKLVTNLNIGRSSPFGKNKTITNP